MTNTQEWEESVECYFSYQMLEAKEADDKEWEEAVSHAWSEWSNDRLIKNSVATDVQRWIVQREAALAAAQMRKAAKRNIRIAWMWVAIPTAAYLIGLLWFLSYGTRDFIIMNSAGIVLWVTIGVLYWATHREKDSK